MKLQYLRQSKLDALKANIEGNLSRYLSEEPWLEDYFAGTDWRLESSTEWGRSVELLSPDENGLRDLENTTRLYDSLKHLSRAQASDERLWAYMTHVVFWPYMRKRWPLTTDQIDKKKKVTYIRERYFFTGNRDRALVRNGIARLWWYGYSSYDSERSDNYELTGILLYTLDITQSLLERSFSRNDSIAKGVLKTLATWRTEEYPMPKRESFRQIMQHLNRIGGVTVLDALSEIEIQEIVRDKLEELWVAYQKRKLAGA